MSYWHTCPGCYVDLTRRRYDEPDRGTLCESCSESPLLKMGYDAGYRAGHEAGVRDTVRAFWAAVCEDEARQHDHHAGYHRWLAGTGVIQAQRHRDAAAEHEVRAAQYRAWAREGES